MPHLDALAARSGVHSVDNALRLLLLLRDREALGVAETARALGVGRATAHRLVTTLLAQGFLVQEPETRLYRAGPALCDIATALQGIDDGRGRARPYLTEVAEQLGETTTLTVLRGDAVVVLEAVEGRRAPSAPARPGRSYPAHLSAEGRVLLAHLPPARLLELYPDEPGTNGTGWPTASRLEADVLAGTRARGHAVSVGHPDPGITSVAAAVGGLVAGEHVAVGVAAPHARVREADDLRFVTDTTVAMAARLTADVGVPERP